MAKALAGLRKKSASTSEEAMMPGKRETSMHIAGHPVKFGEKTKPC